MRRYWLVFLLIAAPLAAEVKITYLANEGVLLTAGDTKVLVDALFRDSLGDYPRHSAATQEELETGKPPFAGVSLALATHYHLDHWDAGAISRFLRLNPAARFASTPQATGMMPSEVRRRVQVLWPGEGSASVEAPGVRLEAVPLVHGQTQNAGLRIEMGDRVLLHLGDADASAANFDRLAEKPAPDVLLAPFWWLLDEKARAFVGARWKPRQVVAIHFGVRDAAQSAEKVRASLAGVWVCTRQGESRAY